MTSICTPVTPAREEIALLGGGCFWCLEAVYQDVVGVHAVASGYAGGPIDQPTYRQVCTGGTGHAEVVQIRFDPTVVSFENLLKIFFVIHDPTTPNRQGHDVGTQYRSVIFYTSDVQEQTAQALMQALNTEDAYGAPVVTQLLPAPKFWIAEPEHQNYYRQHPSQAYCAAVVAPKLAKFRHVFTQLRRS